MSSSHLTNLSPELHLSIISYLSLSDKRLLRCVCQLFNNLLFLDLPLEDLRAAKKNNTILLIENASKGKVGFEPFIIMNVRKIRSDLDEPKSVTISIVPTPRDQDDLDRVKGVHGGILPAGECWELVGRGL